MENKLRRLYALQQIDTRLDELEEEKGDLPAEIKELEENFLPRGKQRDYKQTWGHQTAFSGTIPPRTRKPKPR